MAEKKYGFPKAEHLTSRTTIEKLYSTGATATAYPLRAIFMTMPADDNSPAAKILINVAKKRFKHAVDRNRIKRCIREAYRLNKQPLIEELRSQNKQMAIAILYIDNKHSRTEYLKYKMSKLLGSIIEKDRNNAQNDN